MGVGTVFVWRFWRFRRIYLNFMLSHNGAMSFSGGGGRRLSDVFVAGPGYNAYEDENPRSMYVMVIIALLHHTNFMCGDRERVPHGKKHRVGFPAVPS